MNVSPKGLMEILSHEGICLSPYLDSVGVWTIGVGITKYDGKDPRDFGTITLAQAMKMFKDRVKAYVTPVQRLKLDRPLKQHEFDALVSLCFNFGPGNLSKLCHGRTVDEIGDAIMLYTKPPEITGRRKKEQALFKYGQYSNTGKGLVFPVSANHHPMYSKGYQVDVSPYFAPQSPLGDAGAILVPTATVGASGAAHALGAPLWAIGAVLAIGVVFYVYWKLRKNGADKQIHERNGELAPEGAVLRGDGGGQIVSPVHPEELGPSPVSEPVPPVHGSERPD